MKVKNLIFDLGGVIIDLLPTRTVEAFSALSGVLPDDVRKAYMKEPEFFAFERGEISDAEFRSAVQRILSFEATVHEFNQAWNAMLVDLPASKLYLLEKLKSQYTVALLSNTNHIHIDFVNRTMLPLVSDKTELDDYVHISYYSHLMGKRKPEPEIFHQVIDENAFNPSETLFFDDNPENIQAAARLGIQTVLVKRPDEVLKFFNRYE